MDETGWISVHVHYHDPLDGLITDAVRPLLTELTADGLTGGHFFVRHWQGGPHLRLRIAPVSQDRAREVRARLDRHVGAFLARHPSRAVVEEADYLRIAEPLVGVERGQDAAEPLRPNNSVRDVPYEPELARYGGTPGAMRAVERHFTASSELVAELLTAGMGEAQRTGQALAMMLAGAVVAADGVDGVAAYLTTGQRDWGRRLVFGDVTTGEDVFEAKYQRQREHLTGLVARLLDGGVADRAGTAVGRWVATTSALRDELVRLRAQDAFRPEDVLVTAAADERYDTALASVLLFCSHMHNNRLGVSLPEESYLMYLLRRAVSEVTGAAR
ncbi:thiopeptide-type bacteriocin biosynthesis protein [Saccharopolyspora sp. CA-218241]|uniref:thiopeptide-type bacteriocin biosynthesis protein n=1 Tax=Saccharopolyspora sp. CA-218241 TaxID=3240027 RepID=UPI003D99A555